MKQKVYIQIYLQYQVYEKLYFKKFIAKLLAFKPHFHKKIILQNANTCLILPKSTRLTHNLIFSHERSKKKNYQAILIAKSVY